MTQTLSPAELITSQDVGGARSRYLAGSFARTTSATSIGHRSDPLEWIAATKIRIKEFGLLEPDWDSYDASPISLSALDQAYGMVEQMADLPWRPFVVPTSDGGVQFEWRVQEYELALHVQASGEVEVFYSDPAGHEWLGPWGEEPDDLIEVYISILEARR